MTKKTELIKNSNYTAKMSLFLEILYSIAAIIVFTIFIIYCFVPYVEPTPYSLTNKDFHRVYFNKEIGYWVGESGAQSYVLDKGMNKITNSQHSFFINEEGQICGQFGSSREFVIDSKTVANNFKKSWIKEYIQISNYLSEDYSIEKGQGITKKATDTHIRMYITYKQNPVTFGFRNFEYDEEIGYIVGIQAFDKYLIDKNAKLVSERSYDDYFLGPDGNVYGEIWKGSKSKVRIVKRK